MERADGGTVSALSTRTDSLGEARATWKLGPKAGRQRVKVQAGNPRTMPAFVATATALPGQANSVAIRSGDRQLGSVGRPLKLPVVFRSVDRHGNAVPGAVIRLDPGTGRLSDSSLVTDSAGRAQIMWTLGRPAGLQRILARLDRDTAETEITALARPGKAAKVAFLSAPETARTGRPCRSPWSVEVTDAYGNALGGQTVIFKPSSGSVTPARGLTDAQGRTTVRWTLGPKSKKPELVATVAGSETRRMLALSARP